MSGRLSNKSAALTTSKPPGAGGAGGLDYCAGGKTETDVQLQFKATLCVVII